jgi:hypothetical protein
VLAPGITENHWVAKVCRHIEPRMLAALLPRVKARIYTLRSQISTHVRARDRMAKF